jgi:cytochrome c551/c552
MLERFFVFIFFIVASLTFIACEHQPKEKFGVVNNIPVDTTKSNCSPDTIYFVNEILPMITSNCAQSGCHDNITKAEGVVLDSYNNIMKSVRSGSATNSKLYKEIIDGNMPPAGSMTQEQMDKIKKWINQGAKNNYCNSGCDSTLFTYSGSITKIINTNCIACHQSGIVLLNSYTSVKALVDNGRFLGAIKHQSGFQPMPSPYVMLSDCDMKKIAKWINAGAQNN